MKPTEVWLGKGAHLAFLLPSSSVSLTPLQWSTANSYSTVFAQPHWAPTQQVSMWNFLVKYLILQPFFVVSPLQDFLNSKNVADSIGNAVRFSGQMCDYLIESSRNAR